MIERIEPPAQADEQTLLISFLDYYRATLLLKAEGLSDDQARRAVVPPSDLNLMGLVRHMAEVERHWFQRCFIEADSPSIYYSDQDPDGDMHPGDSDSLAEAFATFNREVARSREITAAARPEQVSKHVSTHPERAGFQPSMRWILIHMIEEYARHCGHADLLRECIDGATGD